MSPPRTKQSITVVPIFSPMSPSSSTMKSVASLSQIVIEEDHSGESSDGIDTITDAYERHVKQAGTRTHPPSLQDVGGVKAPNIDSESTWSASEGWESQWSDVNEDFWTTVNPDSRKREIQESTEEEESEVIRINVGSFSNSTLSRDSRESKKAKNS